MNYSELVTMIQDLCENEETSFVAHIPDFVEAAEKRIYNAVLIPALRKTSTADTLTLGDRVYTLPADWLATFSLAVIDPVSGAYSYLLNKDMSFIRESFPDPTVTGVPTHYAHIDETQLVLGPTPDAAYGVEINYFYYPESIVTAGTTWLGDNFDMVLLYGAVREAYLYMKGEADLAASYETKYQEALLLLKELGEGKNRRDEYRSGQRRQALG